MRSSAALAVGLLLLAAPAAAQVRVDAFTEVRSIRFRGVRAVSEHTLRRVLVTRGRGPFHGLRVAVGKLPLVPSPTRRPFGPLELQRDVARLRGAYAARGYFAADVRYEVRADEAANLLDITFVVEEGRPTIVRDVTILGPDSLSPLPVPPREERSWDALRRSVLEQRGQALTAERVGRDRDRLQRWWQDHRHPRVQVNPGGSTDTARAEVALTYQVLPGPSERFGDIRVEGTTHVSEETIRRQAVIRPGDPYSFRAVEETRENLQGLDVVQTAEVDVPALKADSGAVARDDAPGAPLLVRIQVTEAERRLVSGDLGYVTDAGVSSEARWQHRGLTGGGRSVTLTGLAQTGWLAVTDAPDRRYRLAVSLSQPAVAGPRTSVVMAPFIEHRDDIRDRSTQIGFNATLVHRWQSIHSFSVDYQYARRHVYEYHFGDLAQGTIDLLSFIAELSQGLGSGALATTIRTSALTASGVLGSLDNPANPTRGVILRPEVQATVPTALSSTAYLRLDGSANGYLPLGRKIVLASRFALGRLLPFGKSLPGPGDEPTIKFLQLRNVTFTGGGTGDVRGWDSRMLGPKVPDVRLSTEGDSVTVSIVGFVPLTGFARTSFSLELQLPLPGFDPHFGSHVFLDGGKVWTSDARFEPEADELGQERLFLAAGGGLDFRTPVGPIKLSMGYKLNPSILDVIDARDLNRALIEGTAIHDLPRKNSRRWQWHLAIGASF